VLVSLPLLSLSSLLPCVCVCGVFFRGVFRGVRKNERERPRKCVVYTSLATRSIEKAYLRVNIEAGRQAHLLGEKAALGEDSKNKSFVQFATDIREKSPLLEYSPIKILIYEEEPRQK
jgi:hypothetical protein